MTIIFFRDKIDLNLDYNLQSVAIRKNWNFNWQHLRHLCLNKSNLQLSPNKTKHFCFETWMIVAQVIRISNFPLFEADESDKIRQLWQKLLQGIPMKIFKYL